MKVNETVRHYLGMFLGFGLFFLLAIGGWELSERSDWFANLWASELNRWLLLLSGVVLIPMSLVKTYSYFWGKGKLIRTFKQKARYRISNCKDNDIVRVQGNLVALTKPLTAPLTQRECSAYTFRFSEKVQRVNSRSRTEEAWQTSRYVESAQPFLIKCEGVLQPNEQVAALGQGRWIKTREYQELHHLHEEGIENVFELKANETQQLIVSDAKYLLDDVKAQFDFKKSN